MKTVLFIIRSSTSSSSRIRILDLLPSLRSSGFEIKIEELPRGKIQRLKLFREASQYQITVLQRQLLSWLEFTTLRFHANGLGFDFDDAIYLRPASPSEKPEDYKSAKRLARFRRTVQYADFVLPANQILGAKVQEIAPKTPIHIMPSSIITDGLPVKSDYEIQSPPVVGWIGSKTTLRYLHFIEPALAQLYASHPFLLRIIADHPFESDNLQTDFVPWKLETQYAEITRFDIGIMPLSLDPFSEGKASFKLLQYLACGVPSVCSAVGMNIDVSRNNTACLMAPTPSDFASQLQELFSNHDLRRKLGQSGKKLIDTNYSTEAIGKRLSEALCPYV